MKPFLHRIGRALGIAARTTARTLYVIGMQTVRIGHRIRRRLRHFFAPITLLFFRIAYQVAGRPYHWVREELAFLGRSSRASIERMRELKQLPSGKSRTYKLERSRFYKRIFSHVGRVVGVAFNIAAPVAAIVLLVHTFQHWDSQAYGLALEYNGQSIGVVETEETVGDVVNMVSDRIVTDQAIDPADITPTYRLTTVQPDEHFTSTNALSDTIAVQTDSKDIVQATGLYVDGEFVGAVRSRIDLRLILQNILKGSEQTDDTLSAAFVQDVQLVDGMYAADNLMTSEEMQTKLTTTQEVEQTYTVQTGDAPLSIAAKLGMKLSELQGLNPDIDLSDSGTLHVDDKLTISAEKGFFTIKQVKEVTYKRAIAFSTVTEKSASLYIGTSKVVTKGEAGEEEVTDRVTYVDGMEVDRENLSTTVLKEPVTKVVQVGTKKRVVYSQSTVTAPSGTVGSTGVLMWPVPSSRRISDGYGYVSGWAGRRWHGAIDIMCTSAAVVAADSGYVVSAGWHYGYGWNVLIQHDNGLQTFYAHCSSLKVAAGSYVSKGQTIAISGKSGSWAYGWHLHFEVRKNGQKVNPLGYVS